MAVKLNKKQKEVLSKIQEESKVEPFFVKMNRREHHDDVLRIREFDPRVEISEELSSDDMIAVRFDFEAEHTNKPNGAAPMENESILSEFPLSSDFVMITKRGQKSEQYPFSLMEVGQSFVVPVSDKHTEPWNSFGSTVTSASRRHKPKVFRLRRVTEGDKYPNGAVETTTGARVFRIQ